MGNVNNRFDVNVSSETKLKDKNILTFEFKLLADSNCRIKIEACQVYDCDGYMYQASGSNISSDDFILGRNSRFFTELKRVNVTISKEFKSRIGCNMVFTVIDVDDKKKMNLCFQKRSSTKWTFVGVSPLEYKESDIEQEEKATDDIAAAGVNEATESINTVKAKDIEKDDSVYTATVSMPKKDIKKDVINNGQGQEDKASDTVKKEEVKTGYIPSFAKRYSTNYSAGSVAGVIKRPQPKAEKPEVTDNEGTVNQTDINKEVVNNEAFGKGIINNEVINKEDSYKQPEQKINKDTGYDSVPVQTDISSDTPVKESERQEPKKTSGVDAFRELLGAMADISAGKDIDLDLGRGSYEDSDEEDTNIPEIDEAVVNDDIHITDDKEDVIHSYSNTDSDDDIQTVTHVDMHTEAAPTPTVYTESIHTENTQADMSDIPVYYRRKDSIDMLKQRIAADKNNTYLGMTLGAIMDKYDLDNQRLETFLNVFADRYKVADSSVNEQELRDKIEQDIINDYKEKYREELTEQIKKELEEQEAEAAITSEEVPDTLEFYDIEPERVEAYLNSIIEYDADAAAQIGLSLSQTRVSVEEQNGSYTATLYSEASYSKETYVLVRCPIVKVIFYDKKGNIANMAMHSVSRIYTGHDIIQMKLKTAQFKYWQNIGKLKIMITL